MRPLMIIPFPIRTGASLPVLCFADWNTIRPFLYRLLSRQNPIASQEFIASLPRGENASENIPGLGDDFGLHEQLPCHWKKSTEWRAARPIPAFFRLRMRLFRGRESR